ncbi:UDP-N-acetylhexosamine pyrophosphorylase-like protein 1 [Anopheles ziemanni]|uniref:UDP-N-acetylhexosamine pyrophosphorylase-like protein 1 n=1 Tax=Anopheles coustani TaxID=139045 RepID=UPI00265A3F77|nr:UDP-N-acetylhexosamine pyrophosphorylase-like protein 1 [Anopheles coustani]XP_058168283.1 UDP-N-acetylhexosamine pyrophosphorylase-like protein 1 [Anopheles ziemanni]
MGEKYEALAKELNKWNQDHLLKFWDELSDSDRNKLLDSLSASVDCAALDEAFRRAMATATSAKEDLNELLQPIAKELLLSVANSSETELNDLRQTGLEQIREGRVGVILLAGGQGTRLGSTAPKGTYNVGLPSGKSLFQLQAERIRKLQQLAGGDGRIRWYIMTSEHTHTETLEYFKANRYFGLPAEQVRLFRQRSVPCVDFEGRILLDEKWKVATAPDGNGGIYRALKDEGILDELDHKGVLYLHAHSVDNILIKVADPVFIGYCVRKRADCGVKVIEKVQPDEAVGVVCEVKGKYQVVEYSELSSETANRRNPADGKLTFNAGNICNHFFTSAFLRRIADTMMPLHVAKKKIPFVDTATGERCKPSNSNGIKMEKFIFDVFPLAERFVALEGRREEEFSALKNADSAGIDCPSSVRGDIARLHRQWLINAGATEVAETTTDEGNVVIDCEISPLLSYAGEGLEPVAAGQSFRCPVHLIGADEQQLS